MFSELLLHLHSENGLFRIYSSMWEGPKCPASHASAGSLSFKQWAGLNRFKFLGGIRIGMGCIMYSYCFCMAFVGTCNLHLE